MWQQKAQKCRNTDIEGDCLAGVNYIIKQLKNLEELITWSWLQDTTSQIGLESTGTISILSSQPSG